MIAQEMSSMAYSIFPFHQSLARKFLFCLLMVSTLSYLSGQSSKVDKGTQLREKADSFFPKEPDSCLHYIQLAIDHYLGIEDTLNFIECQIDLTRPYGIKNDFDAIDSIIQLNWELAKKHLSPNVPEEAPLYGYVALGMGLHASHHSKYIDCISFNEIGFKIFENLDSIPLQYKGQMPKSYNVGSVCFAEVGDFRAAQNYQRKSLQYFENQLGNNPYLFVVLTNMGMGFLKIDQVDSTVIFFKRAEKILSKIPKDFYGYQIYERAPI